jgi:hypothetical protein
VRDSFQCRRTSQSPGSAIRRGMRTFLVVGGLLIHAVLTVLGFLLA